MHIKYHADKLAEMLEGVARVHFKGTPLASAMNDAVRDYREQIGTKWLRKQAICEALHISPRTLIRWRQENRIEAGKHWRRMGEGSHCLYNLQALEERMNEWAK
jgi:hypothetical protein